MDLTASSGLALAFLTVSSSIASRWSQQGVAPGGRLGLPTFQDAIYAASPGDTLYADHYFPRVKEYIRVGLDVRRLTAFGERKGVEDRVRDRRCRVGPTSLRQRLQRGVPAEVAITAPPFQARALRAARPRAPRGRSPGQAMS